MRQQANIEWKKLEEINIKNLKWYIQIYIFRYKNIWKYEESCGRIKNYIPVIQYSLLRLNWKGSKNYQTVFYRNEKRKFWQNI